jgi:hypothetical protein
LGGKLNDIDGRKAALIGNVPLFTGGSMLRNERWVWLAVGRRHDAVDRFSRRPRLGGAGSRM